MATTWKISETIVADVKWNIIIILDPRSEQIFIDMDYQRFESMTTVVPNLFRNPGVPKYGGGVDNQAFSCTKNDFQSPFRRQDVQVRPCLSGAPLCGEFIFDKNSFKVIEIVRQINDNFIAAVAIGDDKKVLVLMDQHAIHERIRYENLLKDCTVNDRKLFVPVDLDVPIVINDLPKSFCGRLLSKSAELESSGIKLKSCKTDSLIVKSVPKCYDGKQFRRNRGELESIVKKCLIAINDDWQSNNTLDKSIPMFIHCTIATKACHGAIKFGEKLNTDECTKLVRSLMYTEAPSRCAHGRPSLIPLLELDNNSRNRRLVDKKKLNFASLKRLREKFKKNVRH